MAATATPYSKITDPPKTVKEAIDWLIRIGRKDNSSSGGRANSANCRALEKAIQALTGSGMTFYSDIQNLISGLSKFLGYDKGTIKGDSIIKKDGNYTSAYNQNAAQWPTCSKGGTCSCCQQGCQCTGSTTKSCDGSCCNTCDIRVCAGIFVGLVPALHTALEELKKRCNEKENRSKNISELKEIFTALGYEEGQLNNELKGTIASSKLTSAIRKLEGLKKNINNAFDSKQSRPTQNGFTAPTIGVAPSSTTPSTTPRTVREMLLWLMGLPYCQGYKDFVDKLKEEPFKSIVSSSTSSRGTNYNPLAKELSAVIFQLPTVFYSIEGNISYLNEVFEQFKNGGTLKFDYPTTETDMLNTLSAYVAVCYPILKYLMQRCDKENGRRGARGPRSAAQGTTPTDEKDGAWGYLTVSGHENSSGQVKSGDVSGPAPSSVPKAALRDFLVFMGFTTTSSNNTVTGDQLHDNALKDCFSPNVKTEDEDDDKAVTSGSGLLLARSSRTTSKDQKLPALRKLAKHVLQGLYGQGAGVVVSSPNGTTPTTIRQMMLWLIGLPLTAAYKSSDAKSLFGDNGPVVAGINQNEALKDLEKKSAGVTRGHSTPATGKHFKQQLKDSIVGMIMLFQRIEGSVHSVLEFLKEGFKDTNGGAKEKFDYRSGQNLFNDFNTYVYKVHVQLRFLKVMCKTGKNEGGWERCMYALKKYSSSSGVTGAILCRCHSGGEVACANEPLRSFLTDDGTNNGQNKNKFQLCNDKKEHSSMGFDVNGLTRDASMTGASITPYLEPLLDDIPTPTTAASQSPTTPSKPLSLLTQYCVAIGNMEPQSLGDHFDVFRELGNGMWDKIKGDIEKNSLAKIRTDDESGTNASNALQGALQAVWPGSHNKHEGDLRSLTGCKGNNCTPFIATLSHGLYKYCDAMNLQGTLSSRINWLYMKMSSLYGKLTALKTEMTEKCKCCQEGQSSSSCQGIIKCPNCLPQLYKMGLVFGDPGKFNGKKCRDLMDMMENVLEATTSKLCVVFRSIDDKRFWPYLLFSAKVVENNNGKLTVTGDENYNCYTYALGSYYDDTYIKEKKEADKKTAKQNKTARTQALQCNCQSHTYTPLEPGSATATVVTLTLYFKDSNIKTTIQLLVPFHGPDFNPLVRFYPRNLKAIVDWLLRIGQTRLEQDGSVASTKDTGLEDMCKIFWPRIEKCMNVEDKDAFKQLVTGVVKLMGLENKGKTEVEKEVQEKLNAVKKKIEEKINSFQQTFNSILQFSPKDYIDEVIKDFGKQVTKVNTNSVSKDRSFECIAKSVSKCMNTALQTIKTLVEQNKKKMQEYSVDVQDLNDKTISEVSSLTSINELKTLCDGFKDFHEAYDKVTGAFNSHLSTAQQNGGKTHWDQITKCVEAFNTLGGCATVLNELNSMSSAEQMTKAKEKLGELSGKLNTVIEQLKGDDIQTLSKEVDKFIKKLDDEQLKTASETALATALAQALNSKSGSNTFSDFLKSYVSELITQLKKNNTNNTVCDIHLRVRNDLLQLSECLKVMCEVCSTGMKDFANTLKDCVDQGKDHLVKIVGIQLTLKNLKGHLHVLAHPYSTETIGMRKLTEAMEWSIRCVRSLFMSKYIYQTQPIVSNFINNDATEKMTTYLKSLPDLIRDRYVLQKWKDDAKHFCGVQSFDNGIVKETDTDGIKKKLQELLKDIYHNNPESDITIHTFQVRSLIYNFCHKDGIKGIGEGVEGINTVNSHINGAQGTPNPQGDLQWTNISGKKTELLPLLTKLSDNAYLRYFATHLRDSIGYHTLSNTLGALEQVKAELEKDPSSEPPNWNEISKLLKKDNLDPLYQRLQALLDKLHREYIFEYPPFDWTKSCHRVVAPTGASRTRRAAPAPQVSPSTPSDTCDLCVPSMAYIFIGFVPQMYRFFKMLREMTTKDGSEHKLEFNNNGTDATNRTMSSLAGLLSREGWRLKLGNETSGDPDAGEAFDLNDKKTGADVCKFLDDIIGDKEPGALVDKGGDASATDLKALDQLFKAVMQHFKDERKKKRQQREEKLKQEFDEKYKDSGLKFVPPLPQLPSTVRQVLFWLHELDTQGEFYDAMSQHIKNLCQVASPSVTISPSTILHVLKLSITQCLEVLATIEDPGRQNADYYYELYTEEHYYAYPTVNIPLFFYTFVEKLMGAFLELNFVCVQCEFRATEGGWKDCHIGEVYNKAYDISGGTSCICHERKLAGPPMLRVEVEGSLVCPKPLSAFLFSDPKNQLRIPSDVSQRLVYMSKGTMPCGFQLKNKAITDAATKGDAQSAPTAPTPTSVSGSVLVEPLRKLVGGHVKGRLNDKQVNTLSTVIYLRDLLRYVLCLAVRPPWSMSENMAFFYRVTESWKQKGSGGVTVAHRNGQLLQSIHAEIDMFPGSFKASLLTSAVERFAGIEDTEHQKSKTSASASPSGSHHQYDLRTLMGCQEANATRSGTPAQCSPFMFPLSLDVYTHYDHKNSRAYLSWILNFAFGIYGQLKALEEMMKEQKCMRNASSNTSPCPSLPMCPGVLTALYQSGSSFMDQRQLAKENTNTRGTNTTRKTCNDFKTVLTGLFNCNTASCSPLHNLIVQCEAFLWSIRLPFSLVQLSLWSVAILFISYVFVVPLDHFKIKSHLFNRLKYTMHPSLLIADQQRRVSEVAYFSL